MIIKRIDKFIKTIAQSPYWEVKTTIILFFLIQLTSFPSYNLEYDNWSDQYEKSANIFSNIDRASGYSHKAKVNVRITVPIIIKILDLSPIGLIILKNISGIIFIFLILKLFFIIIEDKYLSILLTLCCTFIGFGKASTIDPSQIFDGLSLMLVLCSFLLNNPILIMVSLVSGFFNDERTIISAFLFTLYYFQFNSRLKMKNDNKYPLIAFLSIIFFISCRAYMQLKLGMDAPIDGVGSTTFLDQINSISIGYFMFLEGFWIIVLYSVYLVWNTNKKNPLFIFTITSFILGSLSSFLVFDHGRSLFYSFPIIFFALSYIKPLIDYEKLKSIIVATLISSILIPTISFGGKSSYWTHYSLPTQIIRMITDKY
tara:strand:+ start:476 stop:1588 length:1113 start_codon:yes stop_codon:yes gene_type:complete